MIATQDKNISAVRAHTGIVVFRGMLLAVSCVISFWLITHILPSLYSASRGDELLGGMWAVAATIFVYRYSHAENVRAALSRMSATLVSFFLCFVYLGFLPFHVWGMAALIGIGSIAVTMIGRADDTITTGITTAVVMVVAAMDPHGAWRQPILRLIDTAVGVAVGVAAGWISGRHLTVKAKLWFRT
jgi:uncharacterized membrane protein YccC